MPELTPFKGTGTARVAAWLGQPYESGFAEKQERYLELEGRAMLEVSLALQEEAPGRDFVIDTTGSFVHLPRAVQEAQGTAQRRSRNSYQNQSSKTCQPR